MKDDPTQDEPTEERVAVLIDKLGYFNFLGTEADKAVWFASLTDRERMFLERFCGHLWRLTVNYRFSESYKALIENDPDTADHVLAEMTSEVK